MPEQPNLVEFSTELASKGLIYSEKPFLLHSDGESHWIVDCKSGLSNHRSLKNMAILMVSAATKTGIDYERVAGVGLGGEMVAFSMGLGSMYAGISASVFTYLSAEKEIPSLRDALLRRRMTNEGKKVLAVDDVVNTGNSLIELVDVLNEDGASVEGVGAIVDRSDGRAAAMFKDMGLPYFSLLEFNESTASLRPAMN